MYILLGALYVFGYLWHSVFVLLSVRFSLGEVVNSKLSTVYRFGLY